MASENPYPNAGAAGQATAAADPNAAAYEAWRQWAATQLGVDGSRADIAARAALHAAAQGASAEQAAAAARQAVSGPPAPAASFVNPAASAAPSGARKKRLAHGVLSIVFGIACIALPLFLDRVFIVLPFFGVAYAVYAIRESRLVLGIIGAVLNSIAVIITILAMVGGLASLVGH